MPYLVKTRLAILTMAVVGWGLSVGSSTIRTIFPKGERAMNAGVFRKEGTKLMPKPAAKRIKPNKGMEKMIERKKTDLRSQSGFTLLEMMSVLVILGMMSSIIIHKFSILSETAYQKAIESGIQELNIRETLTWYDLKISLDGWQNDTDLFKSLDTNLGEGYYWNPAPAEVGGSLHFGPKTIALIRSQSTDKSAGSWN